MERNDEKRCKNNMISDIWGDFCALRISDLLGEIHKNGDSAMAVTCRHHAVLQGPGSIIILIKNAAGLISRPFFEAGFFDAAKMINLGIVRFHGLVAIGMKIFTREITAFGASVQPGIRSALIHPAFHGKEGHLSIFGPAALASDFIRGGV
jgi:hypothetical protein